MKSLLFITLLLFTTTILAVSISFAFASKSSSSYPLKSDCERFPWDDKKTAPALLPGNSLEVGQFIESKEAKLILQESGDLQLIRKKNSRVLWHTSTTSAARLVFDGQLYLMDAEGNLVWNANVTNAAILQVQHDCNLVVYGKSAYTAPLWSSGTDVCLKIHIVPHSHDDVGWLLTPERYFDGCRTPGGGVEGVISTCVEMLLQNPKRTYTQVESYFFNRWWVRQNKSMQEDVKRLVKTGQLDLTNGGWSMHDEACVHQESAIANMEVGAQFLKEQFGDSLKLKIGWHIDPFGHASTTPRIMAQMGFDAFFFWRQDDQQRQYDLTRKGMETMWRSSSTLGGDYNMFTSILYNDYCVGCGPGSLSTTCPGGFCCFDCEVMQSQEAQEDEKNSKGFDQSDSFGSFEGHTPQTKKHRREHFLKRKQDYSQRHQHQHQKTKNTQENEAKTGQASKSLLESFAQHFGNKYPVTKLDQIAALVGGARVRRDGKPLDYSMSGLAGQYADMVRSYAGAFRTNQVMIPWGCDFRHNYAQEDYPIMDQIIEEINSNEEKYGMELVYSTPRLYVNEIANSFPNDVWPENHWDYFVYADNNHSYWSGYFTSRAEYKGYERWLMAEHRAAETVYALGNQSTSLPFTQAYDALYEMRQALGVAQHHDSITGTERTHVRNRYQEILDKGYQGVQVVFQDDVKARFNGMKVQSCPLANLSICAETQQLSDENGAVEIVIYNNLAHTRDGEVVTIPIPVQHVSVQDLDTKQELEVQVVPTWRLTKTVDHTSPVTSPAHAYEAYIALPTLDALSYKRIAIFHDKTVKNVYVAPTKNYTTGYIENDYYRVGFDKSTCGVDFVLNKNTQTGSTFQQMIGHYCPHDNSETDGSNQASGAYIFRTCKPDEDPIEYTTNYTSTTEWLIGPLCQEVRQVSSDGSNIQQAWRLCKGFDYIELQNGIGELETLSTGVEVIQRFSVPDLKSNSVWYTDSEALELQKRQRNYRPNYPYEVHEFVGSNFFPCNAFATLNETSENKASENSKLRMGITMDRSRAMSSLHDGELEMLIHRRLLYDDGRGVGQALDARVRVLSKSRLILHETAENFMTLVRKHTLLQTHYPHWLVGADRSSSSSSKVPQSREERLKLQQQQNPDAAVVLKTSSSSSLLPFNVHLHALTTLWDGSLLVRLQHLFDRGEGPYSNTATVQLQKILPGYMVKNPQGFTIVETDLLGVNPLSEMNRLPFKSCKKNDNGNVGGGDVYTTAPRQSYVNEVKDVTSSVVLRPMEIRTFVIKKN